MIGASVSLPEANVMSRERSYADEMLAGLRPEGSAKDVLSRPSSRARSFMRSTEAAVPPPRHPPRRRVVRRNQRQVQYIVQRDPIVGAEEGGRRRVGVSPLDGDL